MLNARKPSQSAEILALEALGWLAGNEAGLARFLAATGSDIDTIRKGAGGMDIARAVLDFLLENEDLLLAFCEIASTLPHAVQAARRQLDGA